MINEIIQAIASGLLLGLVYALLSVGFSLTWGAIGIINISHSILAVLGAYIGYYSIKVLGIDPIISLIVIIPVFYLIGIVLNKTIYNVIRKKSRNIIFTSMVATFGLAIALENLQMWIFTSDTRVMKTGYILTSIKIGPAYVTGGQLISAGLAITTLIVVYYFLHFTYTGKSVRAFEQEPAGAALTGINTAKVSSITSGIAISTAGIAGVALAMNAPFNATIHMDWLITIFLITILGRVGSVVGVLVAGLIIGLITSVGAVWIPYSLINLVMFIILILVLVLRKKGELES